MPDETKPDQKTTPFEPPKDIEDLLKELPKMESPKLPPPKPLLPPPMTPPPNPPIGAPKPASQPPPAQPQQDKFKSYIRTMEEDLAAAKKGIKPEPKPFEIKPPPPLPKIAAPAPRIPEPLAPQMKLGAPEKTRSMDLPKPVIPSPAAVFKPKKINVSPRFLIIVFVILASAAGIWFFISKQAEEIVLSTPTPTPAPTPLTLFEIFGDVFPVTISSTDNFAAALNSSIKNVTPLESERFTAIAIKDENDNHYTLNQVFERLNITPPNGLLENLDNNEKFWVVDGQSEIFDERGLPVFESTGITAKLGLIAKVINPVSLQSALNGWEITMTNDLKNIFGIDPQKATNPIFLDNIYRGVNIRYRNFPYADETIDYTIISLPEFGISYFVLTNSRESIYSAIDLLQNQ